MRIPLRFALLALLAAVGHAAEEWPMRFASNTATSHQAVTLYRDGRAEYTSRITRANGIESKFTATIATWRICPNTPSDARPLCISVDVEGDDGAPTPAQFRFDYLLSGDTFTEFDKMGTQAVLTRVRGAQ